MQDTLNRLADSKKIESTSTQQLKTEMVTDVDEFRSWKYRTVVINLNNRCPLRCRHCALGFSKEYKGTDSPISPAELEDIISSVDPQVSPTILFAGGEPSLE